MKTYNSCHKCYRSNKNKLVNFDYIARVFKKRIVSQPRIKLIEIKKLYREELKVHVCRTVCRRANMKVLFKALGDYKIKYGKLHDYVDEIKRTNPSSTCIVNSKQSGDEKLIFTGFFFLFQST